MNFQVVMRYILFLLLFLFAEAKGQTPLPEAGRAFQSDAVPRVDIYIPADSLIWILDPANSASNYHFRAQFIFSDAEGKDTLSDIGFRIRGNTSRTAAKKSFKISFNTYVPGRDWEGLEKMNLNGEHNDPTMSRSKIGWDILAAMQVPASRANHVALYINDDYFGVYTNVEHIDEEFAEKRFGNKDGNLYKCLWPADLAYEGSDPNIYKTISSSGRPAYELMTNKAEADYSDLAHFIDIINNTSLGNRPCAFEKVFNVESFLKAYAFEILIGHWDNYAYNQNNFYLYKNTRTHKFEYIPYDLDNSLGIDWLNQDWTTRTIYAWERMNAQRPLAKNILEVPRYRERFTAIMDELFHSIFVPSELFPKIDAIRSLIRNYAVHDTYRRLDYGFSMADFERSFDEGLSSYFQTRWGIKEFLEERRTAALQQLDAVIERPLLRATFPKTMTAFTQVGMKAFVEHKEAVTSIQFAWPTSNGTEFYEMKDDGASNDAFADDGIYGVQFPLTWNVIEKRPFYFQVFDNQGSMRRYPACGFDSLDIQAGQNVLFINEFMAKNDAVLQDEAGEYDDWIELYFSNDTYQNATNLYLTDNPEQPDKWQLPAANYSTGYHLFWADGDSNQGAGHTNFKLAAEGEYIGLFEQAADGTFMQHDAVFYGKQTADIAYARLPNQIGAFNEAQPTPLANNEPLLVGLEKSAMDHTLRIFPNPSTAIFYIKKNEYLSSADIQLFTAEGRSIAVPIAEQTEMYLTLNLSTLPNGVYYVTWAGSTQKLIKTD